MIWIGPLRLTTIIIMTCVVVFLLDIVTKVGQAAGIFYIIPISLTVLYHDQRIPWLYAIVLTPIIIGFFLKPPDPIGIAIFDRPTILLMAYMTALVAWIWIRSRNKVAERESFLTKVFSITPNIARICDLENGNDVYVNRDVLKELAYIEINSIRKPIG